jgi:Uncharacterized protein conserved in bacteria
MEHFLEIEYKSLLNEREYKKLKEQFSSFSSVVQINTYFDTEDRSLCKQNISLRVRQINDEFILTIKHPSGEHVQEYNAVLNDNKLSSLILHPLIEKYIFPYISREIAILGALTTSRITIPYRQGILCIDQNDYLNHTDYEIEYELSEGFNNDYEGFQLFLNQHGIEEKKAKGKFFRFIEALDNDNECACLP